MSSVGVNKKGKGIHRGRPAQIGLPPPPPPPSSSSSSSSFSSSSLKISSSSAPSSSSSIAAAAAAGVRGTEISGSGSALKTEEKVKQARMEYAGTSSDGAPMASTSLSPFSAARSHEMNQFYMERFEEAMNALRIGNTNSDSRKSLPNSTDASSGAAQQPRATQGARDEGKRKGSGSETETKDNDRIGSRTSNTSLRGNDVELNRANSITACSLSESRDALTGQHQQGSMLGIAGKGTANAKGRQDDRSSRNIDGTVVGKKMQPSATQKRLSLEKMAREASRSMVDPRVGKSLTQGPFGAVSSSSSNSFSGSEPFDRSAARRTGLWRQWREGPVDPTGSLLQVSEQPLLCMAMHGREVAVGSSDHAIYTVSLESLPQPEQGRTLYSRSFGHAEWVTCLAYLPDGRLMSGGMDNKLCLWDKSGVRCLDLCGHTGSVSVVCSSSDGNAAVSASYDTTLRVWDVRQGFRGTRTREVACLCGHSSPVLVFSWGKGGEMASGSRDGSLVIWDGAKGSAIWNITGAHKGHLTSLLWVEEKPKAAVGPGETDTSQEEDGDGSGRLPCVFISGGQDGMLRVWDIREKLCVNEVPIHRTPTGTGAISCMAVSKTAAGPLLVTAGADRKVKVLEPRASFKTLHSFGEHRDFIYSLHTRNGLAFSGAGDGNLIVHDVSAGCMLYGLGATANGAVRCIGTTDTRLVAAGDDGRVMVYSFA
ncbi:hypothetical protein CBR_g48759 [Chara braunii]|uniref:Uncharacterized protein n=1 Tax=Chara braunii TaxID=69332 RepID=A0A388K4M7_CHABU|nr:hypothetical protein CBR_g48759 [Chara braunii]|eukprot:GBG65012.1 hypothetical protein CBR_g48759 [Chara braunii]